MKTRNEIKTRLLSLSNRNLELEEKLREAERSCQRYKIKTNVQNMLITELMDAIHSMAQPPIGPKYGESAVVNEETCLLLTQNARRIADLCMELEKTKLQQKEQDNTPISTSEGNDENDLLGDEIDRTEQAPVEKKDETGMPTQSCLINKLKEQNSRIQSRCDSLERSMSSLRHNHAEHELRSLVTIQNMRSQMDELKMERKRRMDMQADAEERAFRLQKELSETRKNKSDIVRSQLLQVDAQSVVVSLEEREYDGEETLCYSSSSSSATSATSDTSDVSSDSMGNKAARGPGLCREAVLTKKELLRSHRNHHQRSFPPLLVTVSEDSEDD